MLSSCQSKKKKKMNKTDILKWFLTAGITDCIGETPVNRFQSVLNQTKERAERLAVQAAQVVSSVTQKANSNINPDAPFIAQAQLLAQSAQNMMMLTAALNQFEGCSLKKTAAHTLDGMGVGVNPMVLCVIDSPKSADEKAGQLASGDAGTLLLKMLAAIQLNCQTNTYLAPVIPWRLPGDRKPTDTEVDLCLPFLKRRIELLKPRYILLFGALATKALLDIDSVPKARQQSLVYTTIDGDIPVVATFGPDMVVKGQTYRTNAWADLQKLQKMIQS